MSTPDRLWIRQSKIPQNRLEEDGKRILKTHPNVPNDNGRRRFGEKWKTIGQGLFAEGGSRRGAGTLNRQLEFIREVVAGGGIEPPTRGFSVRCSTN